MSFLNSINFDAWRVWAPLGIAGIIVWSLWLYRFVLLPLRASGRERLPHHHVGRRSRRYHEDPDILMMCLATWLAQDPTEIIVVARRRRHRVPGAHRGLDDPRLQPIVFEHAGKRSALGVGIRAAVGEVLVLTDSDTLVGSRACSRPSRCRSSIREVGAVGTQQNVYQRTSSIWRRIADWLVDLRYYDYVPAMGRKGAVICVSRPHRGLPAHASSSRCSRTSRTSTSSGARCVAGDDGRLTWLVLGLRLQDRAPVHRHGRSRCSPTPSARSSSSGCAGAATPTAATSPRSGRAGSGGSPSSPR